MEGINYFWQNNVAKPHDLEMLAAFGLGALATVVAAQHFPRHLIASSVAVSGVALAALASKEEPSPIVAGAVGMVAASALLSLVEIGKLLNRELAWTVPGVVGGIAMPVLTLCVSSHALWNGWTANSQEGQNNRWPAACRDAAIFAIPAGFNLALAYMSVAPPLMTMVVPLMAWAGCYLRTSLSADQETKWPTPLIMGAAVSSILVAPLLIGCRWRKPHWGWIERGSVALLGLTTLANGVSVGYQLQK